MHLCRSVLNLFLFFIVTASGVCYAESGKFNLQSLQKDVLQTIDRVEPAVVSLSGGGTTFSGVIVSPEGHVLSVAHAVKPGVPYRVSLPDGRRFRAIGKGE